MTEIQKTNLEQGYLPVESDRFDNVIYAVDRRGRGMHIIYGNNSIPVAAENVEQFAAEMLSVWDAMKPRVVR